MRDEFLKLSKVYQEFKSEQITKKQLAKKINNNLKLTKANLKSIKVKNQKIVSNKILNNKFIYLNRNYRIT